MAYIRKSDKRPYTKDEIAEMRRLAAEGLSRLKIAEAIGRTPGSVSGECYRHGIKTSAYRSPYTHAPEFYNQVRALASKGHTLKEISEAMGTTHGAAKRYCFNHGIKTHGHRRKGQCNANKRAA